MANQEDSATDIEIRSSVSHLRELHEKLEEKILKLKKEIDRMTVGESEMIEESQEMLIKGREEVTEILEGREAFLNSSNRNISPGTKQSRFNLSKECIEKFKNLDLGNQEIQSSDNFGVQEGGENSFSPWCVADAESKKKDPIFSLYDSDTSKEEEMEEWNEKNVDPDVKRRFMEKMKGSFSSNDGMEIDIEESSDAFDDQSSSTNVEELQEQRDLLIAGNSEEESSDGLFSSNIDGLVEDLKRLGEEDKRKS